MGCASSAPPKATQPLPPFKMDIKTQTTQSQLAGQHAIHFVAAQKQLDLSPHSSRSNSEGADPEDSWQVRVREVPPGFPGDKLLPPDRQLHDKHMKKLNKFLKGVEQSPLNLAEDVDRKRSKSKGRNRQNNPNNPNSQDLCDSPGSDVTVEVAL